MFINDDPSGYIRKIPERTLNIQLTMMKKYIQLSKHKKNIALHKDHKLNNLNQTQDLYSHYLDEPMESGMADSIIVYYVVYLHYYGLSNHYSSWIVTQTELNFLNMKG